MGATAQREANNNGAAPVLGATTQREANNNGAAQPSKHCGLLHALISGAVLEKDPPILRSSDKRLKTLYSVSHAIPRS